MIRETLSELSRGALADLVRVFAALPENAADELIEAIVAARRIVVFGLGREGLQMRFGALLLGRSSLNFGGAKVPPFFAPRSQACGTASGRRGRLPRARHDDNISTADFSPKSVDKTVDNILFR